MGREKQTGDIVYHYTDNRGFLSIIKNRCLWFSDINKMNDYAEMHWSYSMWERAANEIYDEVTREFLDDIDTIYRATQLNILPFSCSLSYDGDVLSQWRAYSDDGRGVAIGFDRELVSQLSAASKAVEYDESKQINYYKFYMREMFQDFGATKDRCKSRDFFQAIATMSVDMAFHKNPAFKEESEFRLVRAINVNLADAKNPRLEDSGGVGDKISGKKLPIEHRVGVNDTIISYVSVPLRGLGDKCIKEVILGPKHPGGPMEIQFALNAAGYRDVKVKPSKATYQ